MATPVDFTSRILRNAEYHSSLLSRILFRRWIGDAWMSILILAPLLLVVLGWCSSIWETGGNLVDWYFAGYEFIYVLWPWGLERRFFLPIAPLACLYLWRGGKGLLVLAQKKPAPLGLAWLPAAVLVTFATWLWIRGYSVTSHLLRAGFQDEAFFAVWLLSAVLAAWMAFARRSWLTSISAFCLWYTKRIDTIRLSSKRISRILGAVVVSCLIVVGLGGELEVGRANRDLYSPRNRVPPDVDAVSWIRTHTQDKTVVMARHVPTTYHYSNRKVVWFPPSSDAKLLMEGLRKHKVDLVVVVSRGNSYYLPPDDVSFAALFSAYPGNLRLVHQGPEYRIFEVNENPTTPAQRQPSPAP